MYTYRKICDEKLPLRQTPSRESLEIAGPNVLDRLRIVLNGDTNMHKWMEPDEHPIGL